MTVITVEVTVGSKDVKSDVGTERSCTGGQGIIKQDLQIRPVFHWF